MSEDQRYERGEGAEPEEEAAGMGAVTDADAGEPQTPSETRGLGEERGPTEEERDAREEQIRLTRKAMGPTPPPDARAARAEPEPPMEDVPETTIPGVTSP
ncbi:MAG: hypothetical protein M3198_20245 [Actinomycetota bacterium]|nr:hypothetical protein [Actinomycetota bacterium]